jgi:hypothetical protein
LDIARKIIKGDYADVLQLPIVQKIMTEFKQNVAGTIERDAFDSINDNIEDYLNGLSASTRGSQQLIVMMIGLAYLHIFIQANWTGPSVENVEPVVSARMLI